MGFAVEVSKDGLHNIFSVPCGGVCLKYPPGHGQACHDVRQCCYRCGQADRTELLQQPAVIVFSKHPKCYTHNTPVVQDPTMSSVPRLPAVPPPSNRWHDTAEHEQQGRLRDRRELRYRLLRGQGSRGAAMHRAHAVPQQGQGGGGSSTAVGGDGERGGSPSRSRCLGLSTGGC